MQAEFAEVQADLKKRCQEIPWRVWNQLGGSLPVEALEFSDALPEGSRTLIDEKFHVNSSDEVVVILTRTGRIFETLVHFKDSDSADEAYPTEILREAEQLIYLENHERIVRMLDHIKDTQL